MNKKGTPIWKALLFERRLPWRYNDFFANILNLFFIKYLSILLLKIKNPLDKKAYPLSICAIFRDEAPYLKEWIEFHKMIGVKHFYLYNNKSKDNFNEVLKDYISNKEITLINWGYDSPCQVSAYNHCIANFRLKNKWITFIDIDEYVFPTNENNLVCLLKKYNREVGLCISSFFYGNMPHRKKPKGLITENYSKRAVNYEKGDFVKLLIQPRFAKKFEICPHRIMFKNALFPVNELKKLIKKDKMQKTSINIRINHYYMKSEEEYIQRQKKYLGVNSVKKRNFFSKEMIEQFNKVEDKSIFRFIDSLKKRINES